MNICSYVIIKIFLKIFKKILDKLLGLCYNIYRKKERNGSDRTKRVNNNDSKRNAWQCN